MSINGTARINGGVYEGCQHGGGYLSSTDVKIKNATFRNIEYTGNCGWGTEGESHHAPVYCGGESTNANIYFDNCQFESKAKTGSSLTSKYTNTKVYLSNCLFDNNYSYASLRVDASCAIYIGKNVVYYADDVLQNGDNAIFDTTTYADQEFGFETESTNYENLIDIKTGLLAAQRTQVQIITWEEDD